MKATRIALALGAFVSVAAGTAAAQTPLTYSVNGANLTLYGNVDYYLNYQKAAPAAISRRSRTALTCVPA
jgi:hypothetical protein